MTYERATHFAIKYRNPYGERPDWTGPLCSSAADPETIKLSNSWKKVDCLRCLKSRWRSSRWSDRPTDEHANAIGLAHRVDKALRQSNFEEAAVVADQLVVAINDAAEAAKPKRKKTRKKARRKKH